MPGLYVCVSVFDRNTNQTAATNDFNSTCLLLQRHLMYNTMLANLANVDCCSDRRALDNRTADLC